MTYTLFVDNYEVHQRRENALAIFGHGKTCEVTQLKNHIMRKNCIHITLYEAYKYAHKHMYKKILYLCSS